jgi:endonuclease-3 related protein
VDEEGLGATLLEIYHRLYRTYGSQHWWPGDEPFEVMVGAILTQSTSWKNVEKAISSLKKANALNPASIRNLGLPELANLIHSCGYYQVKARKLKAMAEWLGGYGDDLEKAFSRSPVELRKELLGVWGIGPETADSIVLYAAGMPAFVVDTYTRRVFGRLGLVDGKVDYDTLQSLFTRNLPADVPLFNEYHALLVRIGKECCRKKPNCEVCPLVSCCRFAADLTSAK